MKFHARVFPAVVLVVLAAAVVFFAIVPGEVARRKNPVAAPPPYPVPAAAASLRRQLFVADLHADSLLWGRDLRVRGRSGHVDLPRMLPGNVGLQIFSAVTQVPAGRSFNHNAGDAADIITPLVIAQRWPLRSWGSTLERALYRAGRLCELAAGSNGRLLAARSAGQAVSGGLLAIEGRSVSRASCAIRMYFIRPGSACSGWCISSTTRSWFRAWRASGRPERVRACSTAARGTTRHAG